LHGPFWFQYTLPLLDFAQNRTTKVLGATPPMSGTGTTVAARAAVGAAREPPKTMTSTSAVATAPARKVIAVRCESRRRRRFNRLHLFRPFVKDPGVSTHGHPRHRRSCIG
jgi:hypothetical protein